MKYKPLLLSSLGLLPAGLQPADAADITMPVKAAPVVAPYAPLWTGFYAGVNIGGISQESKLTAFDPTNSSTLGYCWTFDCGFGSKQRATGVLGGVQIGYNFQTGNFVYGFETDIGLSSARKSANNFTNGYEWNSDTGIDAFGTARLRLGYAFDRTLIYATGGLAYGKVRDRFQAEPSSSYSWSDSSGWRAGWTAGGGIEYNFDRNWSVKAEGLYYDLGTTDHVSSLSIFGIGLQDRITGVVGRVGVNYQFH